MTETFLTISQAAERLQMHSESVRRLLKCGQLRGIKHGGRWRVPESAIAESTPVELQRRYSTETSSIAPATLRPFEFSTPVEAPIDYEALFAPPTPEEIRRQLEVIASIGHDLPNNRAGLPELDLSGDRDDVYGYTERENAQR